MRVPCFPPEPGPIHPASEVFIGPDCASFEFGRGFMVTRGTPTEADLQALCAFRRANPPAPQRQLQLQRMSALPATEADQAQVKVMGILLGRGR